MIDPKELRIGNLVQDAISLEKSLPVYKLESGVVTCGSDLFSYPYLTEQIKPIPLTPEILQKCGFACMFMQEVWSVEAEFGILSIALTNPDKHPDGNLVVFEGVRLFSIKYLHQLQNLYFALTGQELNVEL